MWLRDILISNKRQPLVSRTFLDHSNCCSTRSLLCRGSLLCSYRHNRFTISLANQGHKFLLSCDYLKWVNDLVYRTIKCYHYTGNIVIWVRSDRSRSVWTNILSRINCSLLRKQKIVAREMKIDVRSVSRMIRDDLGIRAYKWGTNHLLTDRLKTVRIERSKKLLRSYGRNNLNKFYLPTKKYLP